MSSGGSRRPKAGKNAGRAVDSKGAGKSRKRKRSGSTYRPDPSDTDTTEVRFVQPYQATKHYICPGCNGDIPPGMGHMVAVPAEAPDLRRHWHRGCWTNRRSRR